MFQRDRDGVLQTLRQLASTGGVSRREFLTLALAGGLGLTAAKGLWQTARAAKPSSGGILRVGLHDANTGDSLDPALAGSEFTIELAFALRNCLTELSADGQVVGELAEHWEVSDRADDWLFHLRPGVVFHNGKTLTAADVVASLNHHRGEDSKSGAKALLADVTEIRAEGHAVRIKTRGGNADLPFTLADFHFVICPADEQGHLDISGVGSGPYVLEHFEAGVVAQMTRNPDYFKADRGHFDGVLFQAITDATARQNALVTDEVDVISDVELKTTRLLGERQGILIDEVISGAHATLPMFMDTPPFDNPDVRLALKYAIDREGALQRALHGHGTIANDHPISPILPFYSEIEQRPYDPEKARFHLQKAGLDSLNIQLSAADAAFNGAVDLATLYAEDARKAGINVEVVREPNDGYWSNVWLKKPFCVSTWSARPTPDTMFTIAYQSGGDWNESRFSHERFDALLVEAKGELDVARRTELYHQMMLIVRDEGSVIIPFFRNRVSARRDNVMHNGQLSGASPLDGSRAAERWWFS